MYCIKCGVELAGGEEKCPLCGLKVYHPELPETKQPAAYPKADAPETVSRFGLLFIITFITLLPAAICFTIDLRMTGSVDWSGYVMTGMAAAYVFFCLPFWFKKPNPVIFCAADFAAAILLCLYISLQTKGGWFLSFAFPVGGAALLLFTGFIALLKYVKKGKLLIFAGFFLLLGGFIILLEGMLSITFRIPFTFWSLYPLIAFALIAVLLVIIGVCPPLAKSLKKKFFI